MSIYNKKLKLPKIKLVMPQIKIPKLSIKALGIAILLILLLTTVFFIASNPINLNSHILVSWKNNPLVLSDDSIDNSELYLILVNNSTQMQNIDLTVTTDSKEIIIFCPDNKFPTVASGNRRETTCLIRRNPNEKVFAGTYQITISTNLGETTTSLEIRK
jgi:hypothetical protein